RVRAIGGSLSAREIRQMPVVFWLLRSLAAPSRYRIEKGADVIARALAVQISRTLALRLRNDTNVRTWSFKTLRPDFLGLIVADRSGNNHVLTLLPVRGRRDAMLGGHLQRINNAQNLVEVTPGRHRIDEDQFDFLVRSDDENVAHRLIVCGGAALGGSRSRRPPHAVSFRALPFR